MLTQTPTKSRVVAPNTPSITAPQATTTLPQREQQSTYFTKGVVGCGGAPLHPTLASFEAPMQHSLPSSPHTGSHNAGTTAGYAPYETALDSAAGIGRNRYGTGGIQIKEGVGGEADVTGYGQRKSRSTEFRISGETFYSCCSSRNNSMEDKGWVAYN